MNERIKELAEQAKEETDALYAKLTPQEFKDTYNQKFAELIVRECTEVVLSTKVEGEPINLFYAYNLGVSKSAENINKHFAL